MNVVLAVALGGGVGSALRYLAGKAAASVGLESHLATGGVNVLGALALGFLTGWLATGDSPDAVKLGLTSGLLGGFTTFSTFMVESSTLFEDGRFAAGTLNLLLPLTFGLAAAMLGLSLGRSLT